MNTNANASRQSDNTTVSTSDSQTTEDAWHGFHYFCGAQREVPMENTMLLDSGSGIDLFCNADWLHNIRPKATPALIGTNAGSFSVNQQGDLKAYGTVPFSSDAVTNILSLGVITDKYRVTMDSAKDNAFHVHTPEKVVRFGRDHAKVYTHIPTKLGRKIKKTVSWDDQLEKGSYSTLRPSKKISFSILPERWKEPSALEIC